LRNCHKFIILNDLWHSMLLGLRSGLLSVTAFSPFLRLESGNMREPKLRKKKVGKHRYYYTEANGEAYFGKVGDVPFETARDHFREHLGRKQALVRPPTQPGSFWLKLSRVVAVLTRATMRCWNRTAAGEAGHGEGSSETQEAD
jgi:hypothetical protein